MRNSQIRLMCQLSFRNRVDGNEQRSHVNEPVVCIHRQHTPGAHTFPAWLPLTSQWPSQSSVLTPTELISHGSTAHLLPQTLDASHIMLTRNTITSACLHFPVAQ